MKDIAYRAFLKYARLGLNKRNLSAVGAAAYIGGCSSSPAEAVRLLAVYDTLRVLRAEGRGECADAISFVYFSKKGKVLRKNDISLAVRRFAFMNHLDDRTVWRRIEQARKLYYSLVEEQLLCL